jgi:hypothetical protein
VVNSSADEAVFLIVKRINKFIMSELTLLLLEPVLLEFTGIDQVLKMGCYAKIFEGC